MLQLGFLLWLASRARFCCDAYYYLEMAGRLWRDGLLFEDTAYAGYRSYFVPLVHGLLNRFPVSSSDATESAFPLAAALLFWLVSCGISMYVLRRESWRRYLTFALPTLFNPFLLGFVPYPIQESALVIFCVPLFFVLLCVRNHSFSTKVFVGMLCATLAYVIRSSLLWVYLPVLLFLLLAGVAWYRAGGRERVLRIVLLALLAVIVPVAPQSYVAQAKFGTLNPYPSKAVLDSQMIWGVEMLKYATVRTNGNWGGLSYASPYKDLPAEQKGLSLYWSRPDAGLVLALSHVWAGLHYDVLTVYLDRAELHVLSPWLMLSSLVVFFGLSGLWNAFRRGNERGVTVCLGTMLLVSCAYTSVVATEARFGLWGFLALSISASQLFAAAEGRRIALMLAPASLAYALLCIAFNALLLHSAGVL